MPLLRAASLLLPHLVEKLGENEAPAVMGTYLLPRMADELSTVNHSKMTDAIENERLQDLSTLVARNPREDATNLCKINLAKSYHLLEKMYKYKYL